MTSINSYDSENRPYPGSAVGGGLIFLSGRIGMRGESLVNGVTAQTRQSINNLAIELEEKNLSLKNLVKINIYLINMDDYEVMNNEYLANMPHPLPARTCVGVKSLPFGAVVEIEGVARTTI